VSLFIRALYFSDRKVQMCMRVVLCQTKNGLPSLLALSMKANVSWSSTSSKVSMLYLAPRESGSHLSWPAMFGKGGSGPSSWIFCLPILPQRGITVGSSVSVAQVWTTLRGPYLARKAGSEGKEYQYGSDIASR
jgi:hypothetical protein